MPISFQVRLIIYRVTYVSHLDENLTVSWENNLWNAFSPQNSPIWCKTLHQGGWKGNLRAGILPGPWEVSQFSDLTSTGVFSVPQSCSSYLCPMELFLFSENQLKSYKSNVPPLPQPTQHLLLVTVRVGLLQSLVNYFLIVSLLPGIGIISLGEQRPFVESRFDIHGEDRQA